MADGTASAELFAFDLNELHVCAHRPWAFDTWHKQWERLDEGRWDPYGVCPHQCAVDEGRWDPYGVCPHQCAVDEGRWDPYGVCPHQCAVERRVADPEAPPLDPTPLDDGVGFASVGPRLIVAGGLLRDCRDGCAHLHGLSPHVY
eukprot:gene29947-15333_t